MLAGQLDVSAISLMHYAEHSEKYYVLPEFVIATDHAVQSVLLVHDIPLNQVSSIEFSGEGKTTPKLCELLFALHGYKKPVFYPKKTPSSNPEARLIIGDEALKYYAGEAQNNPSNITDLAELWNRTTGHSTIFAIWAVRKEFAHQHPKEVSMFRDLLCRSRQWGSLHFERIIDEAAMDLGFDRGIIEKYFSNLRYDLSEDLFISIQFMFNKMYQHKLLERMPDFNSLKTREEIIGEKR